MTTYQITTAPVTDAPEGTTVVAPIQTEVFETDFQSAFYDFCTEVARQLEFNPPHTHADDEDAYDADEECLACDNEMIYENWDSAEGNIILSEDIERDGWIAIGLSHVDVILTIVK